MELTAETTHPTALLVLTIYSETLLLYSTLRQRLRRDVLYKLTFCITLRHIRPVKISSTSPMHSSFGGTGLT